MRLIDSLSIILEYLKKRQTLAGRIIWIINCVLFVFFFNCLLNILLSPFGYLKEFIGAAIVIFELFIAIFLHFKGFKNIYDLFEKISFLIHLIIFSFLLIIHFLSINYIWKNKKIYLK